jgi:hypothetical protein
MSAVIPPELAAIGVGATGWLLLSMVLRRFTGDATVGIWLVNWIGRRRRR